MQPVALDIIAAPDEAFDLADALGMEGELTALSVTIFDAPDGKMLVQGLYPNDDAAMQALEALTLPDMAEVNVYRLPETDWVSATQSGLPPVRAGRFHVYGAHDAGSVPQGKIGIQVDAGLAFGTGHHGTTAGCLRIFSDLLDRDVEPNSVLDLGCGAGILAIAAAKTLPLADILAIDIDPDAVMVTRQNAAQNGVAERIDAVQADGFDHEALRNQRFKLIFANILAGPLMELAEPIADAMMPESHVILSGILDEKAEQVARRFRDVGLNVTPQPSLEGWTSLLGRKP